MNFRSAVPLTSCFMVTEHKDVDRDMEQLCPKHKHLYKMPSSDVNQQILLSLACSNKQA